LRQEWVIYLLAPAHLFSADGHAALTMKEQVDGVCHPRVKQTLAGGRKNVTGKRLAMFQAEEHRRLLRRRRCESATSKATRLASATASMFFFC
jgi:hypothetical protein